MKTGSPLRVCLVFVLVTATSGCFGGGGRSGGGASMGVSVGSGQASVQVGTNPSEAGFDRSVAPGVATSTRIRIPRLFEFELPNGAAVIVAERRALPLVHLELRFGGGAAAQSAGEAGLAGFTAALLDAGTESRTARQIADSLEFLGAEFSAQAGHDEMAVSLTVVKPRFSEALGILADLIRNSSFPGEEVERVRAERLNQIRQESDLPQAVAGETLAEALFGAGHPYGAPPVGTPATLEGFTRDDVERYRDRVIHAGNATFVVVGDVTRDEVESLLGEAFEGWGSGDAPAPASARSPSPAVSTVHLVDRPGSAQSEIRVGRVAVKRDDPAYFDLLVLNTVLGGSFTSRLNSNLREDKGWSYGAGSDLQMRRAPGAFVVGTAVHTPVTADAVREILGELERIAREPVPPAELARAAGYISLRLPERFETRAGLAMELAELRLHHLPLDFFEGFAAGVARVTPESLQSAAQRVLEGGWAIVVVGDRESVEEPLRALGVGEVVIHTSRSPTSSFP